MIERTIKITGTGGIHARPATTLVQAASAFTSESTMTHNNRQTNLKSIMGVMSLGVPSGSEVVIRVNGPDEEEALIAIEKAFYELQ